MKPLVSIITPTFHHEKFIAACIESVIHQTFTNWEMIIVDDCSRDRTLSIAKKYAQKDERIKIISHTNNWGIKHLDKTYNQALKRAQGTLIAILEGDDFWPKDKLEKQVKDFENKNIVLSFGDWIMTGVQGRGITLGTYDRFTKTQRNNQPVGSILSLFATLKFYIYSPTVMIKKEGLIKIGGFCADPDYPFVDIPTYLALSLQGEFFYHQDILGFYRKQSSSSWFAFAKDTKTMARDEIQQCIVHFLEKNKHITGLKHIKVNKDVLFYKAKLKPLTLLYHSLAFDYTKSLIFYPLFFLRYIVYKIKLRLHLSKRTTTIFL